MFKDDFKAANDAIHADEELINKVLALQNPIKRREYQRKNRKRRMRTYMPAAAAAVVLIAGSAASVPFITRTNRDDGVISSSSYYEDSSNGEKANNAAQISPETNPPLSNKRTSSDEQNTEISNESTEGNISANSFGIAVSEKPHENTYENVSENVSKTTSENSSESTFSKEYDSEIQNGNRIYMPESENQDSANKMSESYDIPSSENIADSEPNEVSENDSGNSSDNVSNNYTEDTSVNVFSREGNVGRGRSVSNVPIADNIDETVVLSMNSMPYTANMPDISSESAMALTEELHFEEWTYRDYFDYLGITLNPALPQDFAMTGHESNTITDENFLNESFEITTDEYGTPIFDNKSFAFVGTGNRYVTIQTTKDTSIAMTYLTNSEFMHSKIGSSYGVLIGTTDNCICYMIKGECAYVINSVKLTEYELKVLLLSVEESG